MRLCLFVSTLLITGALFSICLQVQAQDNAPVHHSYVMKLERWGNTTYQSVELDEFEANFDSKISGKIDRDPFIGIRADNMLIFTATAADKTQYTYRAKIIPEGLIGTADFRIVIIRKNGFSIPLVRRKFQSVAAHFHVSIAIFLQTTPTLFHRIAHQY